MSAAAAGIAIAVFSLPQAAHANLFKDRSKPLSELASGAEPPVTRSTRGAPRTRPAATPGRPSSSSIGMRGTRSVTVASAPAPGQTGYVHFFQLVLPDGTPETQVGIELPDQRIAWSFPGLGVVISPYIEEGMVAAGGNRYEIWHLYGIRPFPDDAAMSALQRDLTGRIEPWLKAATPYCGVDGLGQGCMSCLGFVLRVLYPPRAGDYPNLPRGLARAGSTATGYSTNDLLLHLTGMLDLATREARLQRLSRLTLPEDLRDDLEALLYRTAGSTLADAPSDAAPRRPGARAPKAGNRSTLRRPL